MNRAELKLLHRKLKEIVEDLESAIYSDAESYTNHTLNVDYDEVLTYYKDQDNAEEGL